VTTVLGSITDPNLPAAGVDLALLVEAYHEFSHPWEMMTSVYRALKPGAVLVMVESRVENPGDEDHSLHEMTEAQVRREITAAGFQWVESGDFLPKQHFIVFRKR
ncbi:MAG: methyltransferase domain-containing protein, partial [Candidatus Neomarinimicrobiota bacterium]